MANYYPEFWSSLFTLVESETPEVSVIFRATRSARLNWMNVVEQFRTTGSAGYDLPYAVLQVGAVVPAGDWGLHNSAKITTTNLFYIADPAVSDDIAAHVESRLYLWQTALEKRLHSGFQLVEDCAIDVTESNPANDVFFSANLPIFAGMLTAPLMVGETIERDQP